jgi:hypothetical protein
MVLYYIKVDGKKYEVVYHKITCHLAINAQIDDEFTNDPVLSGGQVMCYIILLLCDAF